MQAHRHTETGNDVFGTCAIVTVSTTEHTSEADGTSLPRNLVVITDWTGIDRFADPTKNILLYPWTPSPLLHQAIATRSLSDLPRLRFILPTRHLAGAAALVD
ncbi:MAG: hypothetical protein NNA20_07445, partial [Nitrospira sp.]|nr:hypothetical protein [Nitrospira sp.]